MNMRAYIGLLLIVCYEGVAQLTRDQQTLLLNEHNNKRAAEGASDMIKLETDSELVELAQEHSARCIREHRSSSNLRRMDLGENIAACRNCEIEQLIARAMKGWYDDEKPKYDYITITCQNGSNWGFCSHYTQIVWAGTSKLGCGASLCGTLQNYGDNAWFLVCNYKSRGNRNLASRRPYLKGPECSKCPGSLTACTSGLCIRPPAAVWEEWNQWADCTGSCGVGVRLRLRSCSNLDCPGPSVETQPCDMDSTCPIDSWMVWQEWTDCSATCGTGTQQRIRTCNGTSCPGDNIAISECNSGEPCIGTWELWSSWSECDATCESGTRTRSRTCLNGTNCGTDNQQTQTCMQQACRGRSTAEWKQWDNWSDCEATCGTAFQRRSRTCTGDIQGCSGAEMEAKGCDTGIDCPVPAFKWGSWSDFSSCDVTCGTGKQARTRNCLTGNNCGLDNEEIQSCNLTACEVVGWNPWGDWSLCSKTCGWGGRNRHRTCPQNTICLGSGRIWEFCNKFTCPVWGSWGDWSNCTSICGYCCQFRNRECVRGICFGSDRQRKWCSGECMFLPVGSSVVYM